MSKRRPDISNTQVGFWTVGEKFSKPGRGIYYHCKCACGKERDVLGLELLAGRSKSCGCRARLGKGHNYIGERHGSLVVIRSKVVNNRTVWLCKCDCGNEVELANNQVNCNMSCGCKPGIGSKIRDSLTSYCKDGTYVPGINRSALNSNNTSGVTGVSFRKDRNKWRASIKFQRKEIFLGNFDNKDDAIAARREAEVKYFGKYKKEK